MKIFISKNGRNLSAAMRRAGYSPDPKFSPGESSFSRRLRGVPYPKFHIYVEDVNGSWVLKLHLDQNRPKYEGTPAHGGEYAGPLVEQEARRIEESLRGS